MNIIHINEESHRLIDDWLLKNKQYEELAASHSMAYFKKCQLHFDNFDVFVEHNSKRIKLSCKQKDGIFLKMKVIYTPKGENEYAIKFSVEKELHSEDEYQGCKNMVEMICSDYIALNALFYFGNYVETKNTKINSKSKDKDKHFFIKGFENKVYVVNSNYHKSPEGMFSVRGHFRHYKNGKIIWIDEFLKGAD